MHNVYVVYGICCMHFIVLDFFPAYFSYNLWYAVSRKPETMSKCMVTTGGSLIFIYIVFFMKIDFHQPCNIMVMIFILSWNWRPFIVFDTLWYFVRNLDVTRCFISSTYSTDWHKWSTGAFKVGCIFWHHRNRTWDLLFERPMPYPLHHGHALPFLNNWVTQEN